MHGVAIAPLRLRFDLVGLLGQAVRFAAVGTASTAASLLLFALMRPALPAVLANLLAIALTTVIGSEVHRRVTFAAVGVARGRMLAQNVASWAWASGATTVGLLLVDAVVVDPSAAQETAALVAMTVVGGVARFAVLRWWVFLPRPR